MRTLELTVAAATFGLVLATTPAPPAQADLGFELNGPYRVISKPLESRVHFGKEEPQKRGEAPPSGREAADDEVGQAP